MYRLLTKCFFKRELIASLREMNPYWKNECYRWSRLTGQITAGTLTTTRIQSQTYPNLTKGICEMCSTKQNNRIARSVSIYSLQTVYLNTGIPAKLLVFCVRKMRSFTSPNKTRSIPDFVPEFIFYHSLIARWR